MSPVIRADPRPIGQHYAVAPRESQHALIVNGELIDYVTMYGDHGVKNGVLQIRNRCFVPGVNREEEITKDMARVKNWVAENGRSKQKDPVPKDRPVVRFHPQPREEVKPPKPELRTAEQERQLIIANSWKKYIADWRTILTTPHTPINFRLLPWPVAVRPSRSSRLDESSISEFLLSTSHSEGKSRRSRLEDAQRIWRIDRFEARIMPRVIAKDRSRVRKGVLRINGAIYDLLDG